MKSGKWIIWLLAHVVIASVVTDELRKRGKTEDEARLGGHLAGGVSGFVLTRLL